MTMWARFEYREFYDVPRYVVIRHPDGRTLLLVSSFDCARDDYDDRYAVYLLPSDVDLDIGSWADLPARALRLLGRVPVSEVRFDPTRRAEIDLGSPALKDILETANASPA